MEPGAFSLQNWIDTDKCDINQLKMQILREQNVKNKSLNRLDVGAVLYQHHLVTDEQALTWLRQKIRSSPQNLNPEQLSKLDKACKILVGKCKNLLADQKEGAGFFKQAWLGLNSIGTEYQIALSEITILSLQKQALRNLSGEPKKLEAKEENYQIVAAALTKLSKSDRNKAAEALMRSPLFSALLAKKDLFTPYEEKAIRSIITELYLDNRLPEALSHGKISPSAKTVCVKAIADQMRTELTSPRSLVREAYAHLRGRQFVSAIATINSVSGAPLAKELLAEAAAEVTFEKMNPGKIILSDTDKKIKQTYAKQVRAALDEVKEGSKFKIFYVGKPVSPVSAKSSLKSRLEETIATVRAKLTPWAKSEVPSTGLSFFEPEHEPQLNTAVQEMKERQAYKIEGGITDVEIKSLLKKIQQANSNSQKVFNEIANALSDIKAESANKFFKTLLQFPQVWLLLKEVKSPLLESLHTPSLSEALQEHLKKKQDDYKRLLKDANYEIINIQGLTDMRFLDDLVEKIKQSELQVLSEHSKHLLSIIHTSMLTLLQAEYEKNPNNASFALLANPDLQKYLSLAFPAQFAHFYLPQVLSILSDLDKSQWNKTRRDLLTKLENRIGKLNEAVILDQLHGRQIPKDLLEDVNALLKTLVTKTNIKDRDIQKYLDLMIPKVEKKMRKQSS